MGKLVAGRIDPSSPRAADWQRIFQTDLVPLLSEAQVVLPLPELGLCGCYLLDLRRPRGRLCGSGLLGSTSGASLSSRRPRYCSRSSRVPIPS